MMQTRFYTDSSAGMQQQQCAALRVNQVSNWHPSREGPYGGLAAVTSQSTLGGAADSINMIIAS
jgi:hypothetical protein